MKTKSFIAVSFFLLIFNYVFTQTRWSTTTITGNILSATPPTNNILGTTTNAVGLGFLDIRFFTNGLERMRLIGEPGFNLGFLGINVTAPNFRLTVDNDINILNSLDNQGYRIGGIVVIQKPGTQNIIAGQAAGGVTPGAGFSNAVYGYQAGTSITSATLQNVFVGTSAGFSANVSTGNSYFGFNSGFSNSGGDFNTYIGFGSGAADINGGSNSCLGVNSGGTKPLANFNLFLGANANPGLSGMTNTAAIGANTQVMQNNNIILGNNVQKIGIGLSAVPAGAQARLDVKETTNASRGIQMTHTGNSSATLSAVGIKSLMRGNGVGNCRIIAAWLESREIALVVPKGGGSISIGFAQDFLTSGGNDCFTPVHPSFMVEIAGTVCSGGAVICPSDISLKTNVAPITNALDKVSRLNGVSFNWVPSVIADSAMTGTHFGFIAQQVDSVIPEIVKGDSIKSLASIEIIPYLAEAIKELKAWKDSVQNANARMGGGNNTNLPSQSAILASGVILYQNTPNPFGDETSIAYYLPNEVMKAQMVFFDTYGKEIKSIALVNRGDAKVELTTSDLASGIYSYRLIADGAIVKTLQMLRAK